MIDAAELKRLVEARSEAIKQVRQMAGKDDREWAQAERLRQTACDALADFLYDHASELLALVEAAAPAEEPKLTKQQDDYLRKGVGERMAIPAVTQALRQRMRDRPVYDPESGGRRELYAMPAATPELLENASVDLAEWLAGEVTDAFNMQRGNLPFEPDGDVEVLRDPYSAKPYVLFYCTLKMTPPPETAQ